MHVDDHYRMQYDLELRGYWTKISYTLILI